VRSSPPKRAAGQRRTLTVAQIIHYRAVQTRTPGLRPAIQIGGYGPTQTALFIAGGLPGDDRASSCRVLLLDEVKPR
jgi:hypothetical protein